MAAKAIRRQRRDQLTAVDSRAAAFVCTDAHANSSDECGTRVDHKVILELLVHLYLRIFPCLLLWVAFRRDVSAAWHDLKLTLVCLWEVVAIQRLLKLGLDGSLIMVVDLLSQPRLIGHISGTNLEVGVETAANSRIKIVEALVVREIRTFNDECLSRTEVLRGLLNLLLYFRSVKVRPGHAVLLSLSLRGLELCNGGIHLAKLCLRQLKLLTRVARNQ